MKGFIAAFLLCLILLGGCAHSLEVKNIDEYRMESIPYVEEEVSIGVNSTSSDFFCKKLVSSTVSALRNYSSKVVMLHRLGSSMPVDVIADINVNSKYEGSGSNFVISWPGFFIFTPAWHGYIYKANYDFNINLRRGDNKESLDSLLIPKGLSSGEGWA